MDSVADLELLEGAATDRLYLVEWDGFVERLGAFAEHGGVVETMWGCGDGWARLYVVSEVGGGQEDVRAPRRARMRAADRAAVRPLGDGRRLDGSRGRMTRRSASEPWGRERTSGRGRPA